MKLKRYNIVIEDRSNETRILGKRRSEIEYLDNSKKTMKDLKDYICEICDYSICPCNIKFFNRLSSYYETMKELKYKDNELLSSLILISPLYASIIQDNICNCSPEHKKYFKSSRDSIIDLLIESSGKKNELENTINKLKKEIIDLKESKIRMEEKENNSKIKIKNLENDLKNNSKEIKKISEEKETYFENLKKTNFEKNQLERDCKAKSTNINNLNNDKLKLIDKVNELQQINISKEKKCLEKDKIIEKNSKQYNQVVNELENVNQEMIEKNKKIDKLYTENNKYKNKIDALNNNISDLNISITEKNKSIKDLEDKEKIAKITIENLEKDLQMKNNTIQKMSDENKSYINDLKKIKSEKNLLEKENKIKENNINNLKEGRTKLEDINRNLKEENKDLSFALKENPDTLKRLHDFGYFNKIKASDNSIQIDSKTNKIKPTYFNKKEFKDFYDAVIVITSVKDISQGWKIEMPVEGEQNINKFKDKPVLRIGIIGNSNKGKSFILSRISKIELASGYYINTKGLSIKYPVLDNYSNRNIVLLDSAGLETPVLNINIYVDANINENGEKYSEKNINKKEEEKVNDDKVINGKYSKIDIRNENKNENHNENDKKRNIFMEKSKEKLITELFLQKYIILNSDILILVVGILTYSEQKLINKILDEIKNLNVNKKIIIIHNLKELFTIEQVEDYIQNTLLKSVTFELVERTIIDSKFTSKNSKKYGRYFVEKNDDNNKNNPDIFHLIFANEDSEAGKYYNGFALEFIEHSYIHISNIKPFDVIKTIKERFKEHSKDFIENNNEVEKNIEINEDEDIIKNKVIRLKNQQEITLKRCLIDEFGLWNLKKNGFDPKYNCYKKDDKLIVKVEVPGLCTIKPSLSKKGELTIIKINGEKQSEKQEEKEKFFNTRVFGEFSFEIILNVVDCEIKNKKPTMKAKNGIVTLEYEIEQKAEDSEFKVEDNGEDD